MMLKRKQTICIFVLLIVCIHTVAGQTCKGKCGEILETCSCHPTCGSLLNCCADHLQFCVQVSPYSGSMLGGSDHMILNVAFLPSQQLICRFKGEILTEGYIDEESRGHCISPLLYETGWIAFDVSTDGTHFDRSGEYLSVHLGKLDPALQVTLVNATQWLYYGTPNTEGTLTMTWNSSLISADTINVELWGYREAGGNISDPLQAEWRYLYSLCKGVANNGSFSFLPIPSEGPYQAWELGSVRVSPSSASEGARDVPGLWSEAHALAWHLGQSFRDNSTAWATDKCFIWDTLEESMPNFLEEIVKCPCTLAQARADTGRFHPDLGCDIDRGSVCTFHPGCAHCVRAIQASPKYGSGQQCCYDHTGDLVLTGDSTGGSSPDRAHDWGSPPYRVPPRVPGLSHWLHDVLSFCYCCLWSDHCHVYFSRRPSSDCRAYQPPRAGAVIGDPHIITFDGLGYTFNGKAEYVLVHSPDKDLFVLGRTEQVKLQNGTLANATQLSSVAMKEMSSDVIEVRLGENQNNLQVLRNHKTLFFTEQKWVDLDGVFLFSPSPQNVTVMFGSGAGVEVRQQKGTMALTVLLPPGFTTQGLLGQMNFDPSDDLMTPLGEVLHPDNASPEDIFTFGQRWLISNHTPLFTYDSKYLLEAYHSTPTPDPDFVPAFFVFEDPEDLLVAESLKMCVGEGAQFCRYDTLTTGSLAIGHSTLRSYQSHKALRQDLEPGRKDSLLGMNQTVDTNIIYLWQRFPTFPNPRHTPDVTF